MIDELRLGGFRLSQANLLMGSGIPAEGKRNDRADQDGAAVN